MTKQANGDPGHDDTRRNEPLTAAGWSIRGRHDRRGPGGGRAEPIPIRPIGDPDAELFRILDDTRLGDLSLSRRAHLHHRRQGAA